MLERILLATDFSDISDEAASQAQALAICDRATLGVCHVLPEPGSAHTESLAYLAGGVPTHAALAAGARQWLQSRAAALSAAGVARVETFLDEGDAYAAIVKRAEAFDADLLVVGSRGRTGIARMLLGSVAEKVVRDAPCPVFVARKSTSIGPIVSGTDFSPAAAIGLRAAAVEAARAGTSLVAIHALELPLGEHAFAIDAAVRDATAQLDRLLAEATRGLQAKAAGEVLMGDAASLLVQRAEELDARLVVISTHGRTGIARLLLGSVAEKVVRLAHTSVLAVRGVPRH